MRYRVVDGATWSPFDEMKVNRLPNWGRWGRQDVDRPDPETGSSSVYGRGRREDEPGWGDEDAAPEPIVPIDQRDAELLDRHIQKLPGDARSILVRAFYRKEEMRPANVDQAIRMLLDRLMPKWSLYAR